MDKDKILDYVRNTPTNTNPNVLKTMLDGDSSAEMNPGYSCTETVTLLTDESVTTVFDDVMNSGILAYSTAIDADTIRVTFDGTEYTCNVQEGLMGKLYGAPMGEEGVDWSEYPFQIASGLRNDLCTESAGTYQIKIETVEEVIETTPCFERAVNSVVGGGSGGSGGGGTEALIVRAQSFIVDGNKRTLTFDKTWQQVSDAIASGTPTYLGISSPSNPSELLNYPALYDFNASPVLIPIYETAVDDDNSIYEVYVLSMGEVGISIQTSPNELMTTSAEDGRE